jgi:hypothetical protein
MMEPFSLLVFTGGLVAGIVIGLLLSLRTDPARRVPRILTEHEREIPTPEIGPIGCGSDGSITFEVDAPAEHEGMHLVGFHSLVVAGLTGDPPSEPPPEADDHGMETTITINAPPPCGTVVVWATYEAHGSRSRDYCCSSSCCSSNTASGFQPMVGATPDAFPTSYRFVPEGPTPPASTGPAAQLVGLLPGSSDTPLRYVAEASTPSDPLWRALGGPGPVFEATLVLRYRTAGIGAVLTVVTVIGDRQVKLIWVTDDWQFYGTNRFRCESDPGLPALVVSPA